MSLAVVSSVASLEGFIGTVSAIATLYKSCHRIISLMSNVGKDAQYLEGQFYMEHARFSAWQRSLRLTEGRAWQQSLGASQFCIPEVQEAVVKVMANIKNVFDEIETLSKKFELDFEASRNETAQNDIVDSAGQTLLPTRTDTSLQSSAVEAELSRQLTRRQTIKKHVTLKRKFMWAYHDMKRLQQLVEMLSRYNDQLDKFTHPLALEVIQEAVMKFLPMPSYLETLEVRTASLESYKAIASASAITRAELDAQIAAWKVEAATVEVATYEILIEQVPGLRDMTRAQPGARVIVELDAPGGRSAVLVEWKLYDPDQLSKSDAQERVNAIVSTLKAAPAGTAVLRSAGYVEDKAQESTGSRIALLYELPISKASGTGRKPSIQTLREILTRPEWSGNRQWRQKRFQKPSLGQRFQLAAQLAEALGSIHNCGWLHKGMRPENIVFVGQRDMDINDPYVLGWAYSRRNAAEEQTEAILSAIQDIGLYHHPDYIRGERYCEAFDQYQLGCLLIEIAHWRLLADIKRKIAPDLKGEDWSDELVRHAEMLKQDMGDIYSSVLVKLLRGLDPNDEIGDFWFDIVWELRQCIA